MVLTNFKIICFFEKSQVNLTKEMENIRNKLLKPSPITQK